MIVKGDVSGDGRITSDDLMLMILCILHAITFTDEQTIAGDINNSGDITATDFVNIKAHCLGWKMITEVVDNG